MNEEAKSKFLTDIKRLLGPGGFVTECENRKEMIEAFSIDWRRRFFGKPLVVCLPSTVKEVSKLVCLISKNKGLSIVPQGGNTGLAGGGTPDTTSNQVVISLKKLDNIKEFDIENKTITVEAGCTLSQIQNTVSKQDLDFALDFSSRDKATIGGVLATNGGGLAVLKHGMAKDLCLGLEVVLPSGKIWNGLRTLRKDNSGYHLKDLFVGSEGTLGIITTASLKLINRVQKKHTFVLSTTDVASALKIFSFLSKKTHESVTAFEFIEPKAVEIVRRYFPERIPPFINFSREPTICLVEIPEFFEKDKRFYEKQIAELRETGLCDEYFICDEFMTNEIWILRESITFASAKDGHQVKNDISLPISKIVDFIRNVKNELAKIYPDSEIINFGHIGDGNLHFNFSPFFNRKFTNPSSRHEAHNSFIMENEIFVRKIINDAVIMYGGSITAEHGIGRLRKSENYRLKDKVEIELMQKIKNALDPKNIFNPDVLL